MSADNPQIKMPANKISKYCENLLMVFIEMRNH